MLMVRREISSGISQASFAGEAYALRAPGSEGRQMGNGAKKRCLELLTRGGGCDIANDINYL